MSKTLLHRSWGTLVFFSIMPVLLSLHISPAATAPFRSPGEFRTHTEGNDSCVSATCHSTLVTGNQILHKPASTGQCTECHKAEKYPNEFGLESDQRFVCNGCHKKLEHEIRTSVYVHGPIKNGDCISCHDPHSAVEPFLLRQPYSELCVACHKLYGAAGGRYMHKPVKDGNCGLCHLPHTSGNKARLVETGVNLCVICHNDLVEGLSARYVHEPIIKTGCSACHDPHSGDNKLRLKKNTDKLCYDCHEEKRGELEQYTVQHKPAVEGKCTACHSPHYSVNKYLLRDKLESVCYSCHKKSAAWEARKFKHGPVIQGNCSACHNAHGSDNAFILRLPFPHKFYAEYEDDTYSLCFLCHMELLVTADAAVSTTRFRNGDVNLHKLHVQKKKGRTCRACHDVHASNQEGRIRDEFPYGTASIPLEYRQTTTGGSCVSGCHRERGYDRVNKIEHR